ncbi:MAG TPA: MerR family transcriptional regulator [Jatrophihabitantaceae bacterium]|jgi:DNA-binding transcriptional MerR regulator|nr:MerR family transcriptional regulator [Jatrophihabitantaceae bacterium]
MKVAALPWVPDTCTLPTAERPVRVAEFDNLFKTALSHPRRVGPTELQLGIQPAAEASVADLIGRESGCCPFFTFDMRRRADRVELRIRVPAGRAAVLDVFEQRARQVRGADRTPGLRSGQVATAAGVNRQTLRYYERRGLIAAPVRSPGGHRLYPSETVAMLRLIKATQRLGFSLDEVAGLLGTGPQNRRRAADAGFHVRAAAKLDEVNARIDGLRAVAATLRAAQDAGCEDLISCANTPQCPLPLT